MKRATVLAFLVGILIINGGCRKLEINEEKADDMSGFSKPKLKSTFSSTTPFGVNLAGGEFGKIPGSYGADYTYPTTGELDYYSSKGLKLIRFPFKWERLQPVMNAALDATELGRVMAVVDAANTRGVVVLLDCHNYGRRNISGTNFIIGSPEVPVAAFRDYWTRMAEAFKSKTNIWAYDLMNEPHDMLTTPSWFDIAQEAINGVRSTDLTTSIMVSGDAWSGAGWFGITGSKSDVLKNLADPSNKLIFQAHVYFDKDASGTYKNSYDLEEAYPNRGVDKVKPFVDWLAANNKKGFIGEYGVPADDSRWLVVLDNFLKYIRNNNINGTYWAGGPWWGTYPLSIEPDANGDKPQMAVVKNYLNASDTPVGTVSDIDWNLYNTVTIGTQVWMVENFKASKYRNGDPIANVTDNTAWKGLTTGAYCWYNNDATNKDTYGALYNWHAVSDSRAIAPAGWHVPTDAERAALDTYLGGSSVAGGPMKEAGLVHWTTPNTGATNSSGFTAVPAGYRVSGTGAFSSLGLQNYLWSSTQNDAASAFRRQLQYNSANTPNGISDKKSGFSVRLIKDSQITVTDIDGNVYNTITIGNQVWMVENLKVTRFRNGDPIDNITGSTTWKGLTTGAYCWYNNDIANKDIYGALYNWHAVSDSRNIAPAGWHVPTDAERLTLDTYLGGSNVAGGQLKEEGVVHWTTPNTGATNTSGFTGVPAGYRVSSTGAFSSLGLQNYIWSATQNDAASAFRRQLQYNSINAPTAVSDKKSGFSVRLVKD